MLELEEARRLMLASINPLPAESIPLGAACGRILASDVFSPLDLPAFANSAMDGYAARAVDLAGGGQIGRAHV